jgi:plastocyanin
MKLSRNGLIATAALALIAAVAVTALFPVSTQAADQPRPQPLPPAPAWFSCVHVVRSGETMFSVALLHGTSPFVLANMNGMSNFGFIFVGIVLRVPCVIAFPSPVFQPVIFQFQPFSNICNIHFVQRGEWLKLIAVRFGVPWQSIAAVNRLFNPNLIFPGERLLIPCSSGANPTPMAGSVTVMMQNIMFNPATVTIHVGQRVIWHNMDSVQHSATQGTCSGNTCTPTMGGFDTGLLNPGQASGAITFSSAGTFHYYCRIHGAMMQGDVVVMP